MVLQWIYKQLPKFHNRYRFLGHDVLTCHKKESEQGAATFY